MNKQLQGVAVAALVLIATLMVNVNYLQGVQAEKLRAHEKNARQFNKQFEIDRGPIVIGGQNVVYSQETGKQLKYQRVYRNGEIYAPVTGYMTAYSKTGIEKSEDGLLNGTDDRLAVRRFLDVLTGKPAKGSHVELTIDPEIQQLAYRQLKAATSGRGAAVAIEPETGKILAMVSLPSYDPNLIATNDFQKADEVSKRLSSDKLNPMLNKAVAETFAPGSTFKVVTGAAALADGYSKDSPVDAPPTSYVPPGTSNPLNNFDGGSCPANATLEVATAQSCNTVFGKLGAELVGNSKVAEMAAKFGFGRSVDVPMRSAKSIFPKEDGPALTALDSIGQGSTTASPLQMAMVAAGVANNGSLMKPYLVDKVKAPNLSVLEETEPEEFSQPLTRGQAEQMKAMMGAVVSRGTARGKVNIPQGAGGKTGTADIDGKAENYRWFIGFAPLDEPKVAVAIVTEGPGTGGENSAPIGDAIMRAVVNK